MSGGKSRADRGQRGLARVVTWGTVLTLLVAASAEVEAWPLTGYRLFSGVRTGTAVTSELVAVGPDGARTVVQPESGSEVLTTTSHLYPVLRAAPPQRARDMVDAWLDLAGIDPADVSSVRLERVTRDLDPTTLTWDETDRTLVVEVVP